MVQPKQESTKDADLDSPVLTAPQTNELLGLLSKMCSRRLEDLQKELPPEEYAILVNVQKLEKKYHEDVKALMVDVETKAHRKGHQVSEVMKKYHNAEDARASKKGFDVDRQATRRNIALDLR